MSSIMVICQSAKQFLIRFFSVEIVTRSRANIKQDGLRTGFSEDNSKINAAVTTEDELAKRKADVSALEVLEAAVNALSETDGRRDGVNFFVFFRLSLCWFCRNKM